VADYYLNASSIIQDGTTPETGYYNVNAFLSATPSPVDNSNIYFVGNIDDSDDGMGFVVFPDGVKLQIRPWSGNSVMPVWKIDFVMNDGVSNCKPLNIDGIKISAATSMGGMINLVNIHSDVLTIENCILDFVRYDNNNCRVKINNNNFINSGNVYTRQPYLNDVIITNNKFEDGGIPDYFGDTSFLGFYDLPASGTVSGNVFINTTGAAIDGGIGTSTALTISNNKFYNCANNFINVPSGMIAESNITMETDYLPQADRPAFKNRAFKNRAFR
jgi:hypothetical protein